MDTYNKRGVSSTKEDVHNALKKIDAGLYPGAFCKIIPDYLGNDPSYCTIMHSDGAGTKSSLAYLYYKETGDLSVFKGIAMDSIVMNTDDVLCAGAVDNLILSSTIGRNPKRIPGEIIKVLIEASEEICSWFSSLGINMKLSGGETADVGDLVRTVIVDTTITARISRNDIIDMTKIKPGMVIVGFSSSGQASYEHEYNSGIGSNGLTSARHDIFNKIYREKYPESYNPDIEKDLVYAGPYKVDDTIDGLPISVGKAVLSPTRTYLPVMKKIIDHYRNEIGGIVHCSGGGQVKCIKFGKNVHYVKNSLFDVPPLFKIIRDTMNTPYREMYQVFNMGHRMEIYVPEKIADDIMKISQSFNVASKIIGHVEVSERNKVTITAGEEILQYESK
jgi:phosphoribosylformylglycinamidine cyclo-ligase